MALTELSSPTHVHYEESNLSFLQNAPRHFNCSIQLICIGGEGLLSTGAQRYALKKNVRTHILAWQHYATYSCHPRL